MLTSLRQMRDKHTIVSLVFYIYTLFIECRKSLNITKGLSDTANRRTDSTMVKKKGEQLSTKQNTEK
jgi:hypothetical protein